MTEYRFGDGPDWADDLILRCEPKNGVGNRKKIQELRSQIDALHQLLIAAKDLCKHPVSDRKLEVSATFDTLGNIDGEHRIVVCTLCSDILWTGVG